MPAEHVAAVILAGGRGQRLGGTLKSELRVGDVRLLDRVLPVLAGCRPLVLAHGPHDPVALAAPAAMQPVADLPADCHGPMAGLAAAVAAVRDRAELLACVAVDTPFLPPDFVGRLLAELGGAPVAVAGYGGQPYPTNSLWRLARFRDLPERVLADKAPHSLKALAAEAGGVVVEWPEDPAGDPFANINTPADLAAAEARAATSATGF